MRDSVLEHEQEALERYFASLDGVVLAYVFGSHARGETWAHSDVDVAVLLEGLPDDDHCFDMRLQVVGGVMDVLQTDAVDALILNQAPPALAHAVLRDGILIFCGDERTRIDFYLRTVNRYLDFKPVLRRHQRAILESARRGELLGGHNRHRGTLERYQRLRERLAGAPQADA